MGKAKTYIDTSGWYVVNAPGEAMDGAVVQIRAQWKLAGGRDHLVTVRTQDPIKLKGEFTNTFEVYASELVRRHG